MPSQGDSQRIAAVKGAVTALKAESGSAEPNSAQLYSRLSDHFADEMTMLRFVSDNWWDIPEAVRIADDGPGFYFSPFPLKHKDTEQPVPHCSSDFMPIPSADEVKAHYNKWDGDPTFVIAVASRVTAIRVIESLKRAPQHYAEDSGSQGQPWWKGVVVVTGRKPSRDEEVFYKWSCSTPGRTACYVYADGDPDGFAAARRLLGRTEDGEAVTHAEWSAQTYGDIVHAQKATDVMSGLFQRPPGDRCEATRGRLITQQSAEVQRQLAEWCSLESVPRACLLSADRDLAEKAVLSPIGDTARQLRDIGILYPLVSHSNFIVNKLRDHIKGTRSAPSVIESAPIIGMGRGWSRVF